MPNLLTKSGRAQRKCDACLSSVQATFSSIYVTQERALKLQQVFNQSSDAQASQQMLQIKAVNLSSELEACLLAAGLRSSIKWTVTLNEHTTAETAVPLGSTGAAVVDSNTASTTAAAATGSPIGRAPNSLHSPTVSSCSANISRLSHRGSNSTKGTCNSSSSSSSSKKMAKGKNTQLDSVAVLQASQITPDCNLVLIELTIGSSQLTYAERCIAAFALLSCVPVVFVAAEPCAALDGAAGWVAGKAWGICSSYLELEQLPCCATEAPRGPGACCCHQSCPPARHTDPFKTLHASRQTQTLCQEGCSGISTRWCACSECSRACKTGKTSLAGNRYGQ
eukprot:GHRR01008790.1.p1 GENE.GHRR01008790.1~~GHRR01008790.1.p1  ORF type:complete len:337 (+),score=104.44 GHRR01008790.1:185-1195(+)